MSLWLVRGSRQFLGLLLRRRRRRRRCRRCRRRRSRRLRRRRRRRRRLLLLLLRPLLLLLLLLIPLLPTSCVIILGFSSFGVQRDTTRDRATRSGVARNSLSILDNLFRDTETVPLIRRRESAPEKTKIKYGRTVSRMTWIVSIRRR